MDIVGISLNERLSIISKYLILDPERKPNFLHTFHPKRKPNSLLTVIAYLIDHNKSPSLDLNFLIVKNIDPAIFDVNLG